MEYYPLVKTLHMSAAFLTFLGFMIRGFWMLRDNPLLQSKLSKILPHIIDTTLLASAISLLVILELNPLELFWVLAKIGLLVAYIIIGTVALKRGKTKEKRVMAYALSLAILVSIFAIAAVKPWT